MIIPMGNKKELIDFQGIYLNTCGLFCSCGSSFLGRWYYSAAAAAAAFPFLSSLAQHHYWDHLLYHLLCIDLHLLHGYSSNGSKRESFLLKWLVI